MGSAIPDPDTVDRELRQIVRQGLYFVERRDVQHLACLSVLGGDLITPVALGAFRTRLISFIHEENEFSPEVKAMALRLLGATAETRNKELPARQQAMGEVVWKNRTVQVDAVRRKPNGRQEKVLRMLTEALVDGANPAPRMDWDLPSSEDSLYLDTYSSIIDLDANDPHFYINHIALTVDFVKRASLLYFHPGMLTHDDNGGFPQLATEVFEEDLLATEVLSEDDEYSVYGGLAQRPDRPEGCLSHLFFLSGLPAQSYVLAFQERLLSPALTTSIVMAPPDVDLITFDLSPQGHLVKGPVILEIDSTTGRFTRAWYAEWNDRQYTFTRNPAPKHIYLMGWTLEDK